MAIEDQMKGAGTADKSSAVALGEMIFRAHEVR